MKKFIAMMSAIFILPLLFISVTATEINQEIPIAVTQSDYAYSCSSSYSGTYAKGTITVTNYCHSSQYYYSMSTRGLYVPTLNPSAQGSYVYSNSSYEHYFIGGTVSRYAYTPNSNYIISSSQHTCQSRCISEYCTCDTLGNSSYHYSGSFSA